MKGQPETISPALDEPGIPHGLPVAELMIDVRDEQRQTVGRYQTVQQREEGHRVCPARHRHDNPCSRMQQLVGINKPLDLRDKHKVPRPNASQMQNTVVNRCKDGTDGMAVQGLEPRTLRI